MAANWWEDGSVPVGRAAASPLDAALQAEGVAGHKAEFIRSTYQQESGSGKNTKTSNADAVGGMQIIPATFNRMADKGWDIQNPAHNMRAGVRYAARVYDMAGGDPALAGAGYYGGEGAIDKARRGIAVSDPRNPKAPNTLQYGQQVAARMTPNAAPKDEGQWWAADSERVDTPAPAKAKPASKGYFADRLGELGDMLGGGVKGASQIGVTLLAPVDMAKDAIDGKGLSLESNRQRRKDVSEALTGFGADLGSTAGQFGQIATEIAGTAGVGGGIANGLRAVPAIASRAGPVLSAIETAGMRAGGATGVGSLAARATGGAVTGAASAGMVNPEDAGTGAMIGGAMPLLMAGAGRVGGAIGRTMAGPAQAPEMQAAITAAREAGYVIPPTQANPTLTNRLLEGFSGKITTAQNASARNQQVTNRLAATTLGLPGDIPITRDALNAVRRQAGQAYDAVASAGVITPGPAYEQALNRIAAPYQTAAQGFPNAQQSPVIEAINSLRSPSFDASAAVAQLRNVREMADTAFAQGNRGVGRSLREGADALESAVEAHLAQGGPPQLLQEFRGARRLIAQTYSVEKALNPTTGSVDARKLAAQVAKNRPMDGPMREAADFAARFPKAAQPVEAMGSLPQTSPLDWGAMGMGSALTGNPLMMAGVAARPIARSLVLSGPVQNRLVQAPAGQNALAQLLANQQVQQLGYRAAPIISGQ